MNAPLPDDALETASRRMLKQFVLIAGLLWAAMIGANALAWTLALRPENQAIVQFTGGWDRIIKPVAADRLQPEIAVFGASWARDMFDPETITKLSGKLLFNHAVTGGTPYEARRFAESLLASDPRLTLALLNIDSLSQAADAPLFNKPFNPAILNTDEDGNANPGVTRARLTGLLLSGASLNFNASLVARLWQRDVAGLKNQDIIASYDRADFSARSGEMRAASEHFLGGGGPLQSSGRKIRGKPAPSPEFERTVKALCAHGVRVIAYFTPHHATDARCSAQDQAEPETRARLLALKSACPAGISMFDFGYPNAITLEGISRPTDRAFYFRPDGHPRPVLGDLIYPLMVSAAPTEASIAIGLDARASEDLLAMADGEFAAWSAEKAARCQAVWAPEARSALMNGRLPQD